MKPLYRSVRHFLVRTLHISFEEALVILAEQQLTINGQIAVASQPIFTEDEVVLNGQVLKAKEVVLYIAYYKPFGVESTLNPLIPNNLASALSLQARVFPVGRLDKESEGLMLLTNDGSIFNKVLSQDHTQEKEYIVCLDKPLAHGVCEKLAQGVEIMGKMTLPCQVAQIDPSTFRIILTEGRNRQIRRMCYKLGYNVTFLQRIRIATVELKDLTPGQWRNLSNEEIEALWNRISS